MSILSIWIYRLSTEIVYTLSRLTIPVITTSNKENQLLVGKISVFPEKLSKINKVTYTFRKAYKREHDVVFLTTPGNSIYKATKHIFFRPT